MPVMLFPYTGLVKHIDNGPKTVMTLVDDDYYFGLRLAIC